MFWAIAPRSPRCDGAFSPARWEAFKTDIARFREILGPDWRRVLLDHGYNPTPIWTLIGRPLTGLFPVETGSLWILARLDLALVLILLAAIGWAFGFEAACIAAIAWGANPTHPLPVDRRCVPAKRLAVGVDAGAVPAAKGMHRGAGALLTLSSLLRIFPALFVVRIRPPSAAPLAPQRVARSGFSSLFGVGAPHRAGARDRGRGRSRSGPRRLPRVLAAGSPP